MKYPMSLLFSVMLAFVAGPVLAETPPPADGELHVTMKNAEYVKVQVNGEDTDNTEFEKNGKVVIVKGLSLTQDLNAVTLVPNADSGLKPLVIEVTAKDFKRQIKKRVLYMIASKAVSFEKGSAEAPPAPEKPKDPPVAPPPPQKDDL